MRKEVLACVYASTRGTPPFLPQGCAQINLQPCAPAALNHAHLLWWENLHARRYTGANLLYTIASFVVNLGAFVVPGSKAAGEYAKIERAPPPHTWWRDQIIESGVAAAMAAALCGTCERTTPAYLFRCALHVKMHVELSSIPIYSY